MAKHFHAVRLSCGTQPAVPADMPLVIALNHPSWWDPLIGVVLAGLFPERTHYAPMEARMLDRYRLFKKLGFYGVEQGPRGAAAFLRVTAALLANCRMYHSAGEVWRGLAKNAIEGLGSPRLIVPSTLLLLGGQVFPVVLLVFAPWLSAVVFGLSAVATLFTYAPRLMGAVRFRQSILSVLLHPVGVLILVTIQWYALLRHLLGRPSGWKGRTYAKPGVYPPRQNLMSGGVND